MFHGVLPPGLADAVFGLSIVVLVFWLLAKGLLWWDSTRAGMLRVLGFLLQPLQPIVQKWAETAAEEKIAREGAKTRKAVVESVVASVESNVDELGTMINELMVGTERGYRPQLTFAIWEESSEVFLDKCRDPTLREQATRFYESLEKVESLAQQLAEWEGGFHPVGDTETKDEKHDRLQQMAEKARTLGEDIVTSHAD